ncbi:hypothetical protein GCM10007932_01610 [Vibrio penaeicida]|uniref:Uncharacterized protein n=1 Tax=Vibrio penaeicida TaxID=104609 RepID=A0AAV5NL77_9VIBR|nr:hypothetical protein GCM10007932_01610 [Vibrio penaeicida]
MTNIKPRMLAYFLSIFAIAMLQLLLSAGASASVFPIEVTGEENGKRLTGRYLLWHDPSGKADIKDAIQSFEN